MAMIPSTANAGYAPGMYLVPLIGPQVPPFPLQPKPSGLILGRHEQADLRLPAEAEKVSRHHARFDSVDGQWRISDLNSRWGTYLNGVKLTPSAEVSLNEGDLVRITPWTFRFSASPKGKGMASADDTGRTMIRTIGAEEGNRLQADTLALLLESTAAIHAAGTDKELGTLVIDAALRGTGLTNGVMLRQIDSAGHVEIVASRFAPGQAEGVSFSRSLINAALDGNVAELSGSGGDNVSQSIVQMKINSALCVPLMLGPSVAAVLYLDSRGSAQPAFRPSGSAFCVALGKMASLALSNIKRIDIERRQATIEAELSAAAVAQKWIFPKRTTSAGNVTVIGESKAGQYVGGDFFDVIDLGDGRVAVTVGDVAGKGVAASVLMTATQGFLHAALREHGDAGKSVTAVNEFVSPRRPASKFITMWVGVFDSRNGRLSYVDAGHSYALLKKPNGSIIDLNDGSGVPIGVLEDAVYSASTIEISPGDEALVVSDGIIEQTGLIAAAGGQMSKDMFEMYRVRETFTRTPARGDAVAALFDTVIRHAGTTSLADDATAVHVRL